MNLHVVFEGDSRTYQDSWTDIVVDTLQVEDSFVIATDGARWTTFESRAATLDAMLVDGKNNILFVWGGVNATKDGKSAEQLHTEMQAYCTDRRAIGWFVIAMTEISANPTIKIGWDVIQPELNRLIRDNWTDYADMLVDLDSYPQLQDYSDITYFVDGVHLTEAGNQVVADAVITAMTQPCKFMCRWYWRRIERIWN